MSGFSLNLSQLLGNVQNNPHQVSLPDLQSLIADCSDPTTSSILRTNRAIAFYLSGQKQEAIEELQKSVENNHLNYVSYFDLFSVMFISNKTEEALKNLCCAISCLYLLRGKKYDKQTDINKAIKHSENNLQARLLKGMHYFAKSKYSLALNQINWVLQMQPNNTKFIQIKQGILAKINKGEEDRDHTQCDNNKMQSSFPAFDQVPKRLQCSLYEEEQLQCINAFDEINKKLSQFMQLYVELNADQTNLVKKSPMVYLLGKIKKQAGIQRLKNSGQKDVISSSLMIEEEHEEAVNSSTDVQHVQKQNNEVSIKKKEETREPLIQGLDTQSINLSSVAPSSNQRQDQPSGLMINSESQSFSRTLNSGMPESSSYTLHAFEDEKNLSIKVNKIELTGIQEQEKAKLKNLYFLFEYGEQKYNSKEDGEGDKEDMLNNSFDAELEDEPQVLIISLYNKEIHAFKDRFVGSGAKQIIATGKLEVPMYKDSQKMQSIGRIIVDVKYK